MRFANTTLQIFMYVHDSFNHYITQYGVPLDDRHDYTKTDWLMWVAAMGNEEQVCTRYSGTPLQRTPLGTKILSAIARCP